MHSKPLESEKILQLYSSFAKIKNDCISNNNQMVIALCDFYNFFLIRNSIILL